jgi:hypothetical protein
MQVKKLVVEQTGGPASVTLADADTMMATFDASTDTGVYTFTLTTTDAYGLSDDDDATITVELNTVYLPLVVRE